MTRNVDIPGSKLSQAVLRWGPVLLWAAGIFYFSSQRYPLGSLSQSPQHRPIGRLAHLGEYAGLAALLYRALALPDRGPGQTFWLALGGALAYAILDEIHQGFVPGRTCSLLDVGYDLAGALTALLLIETGRWVIERTRRQQDRGL